MRIRNIFLVSTTTVAPPTDSPPTCLTPVRSQRRGSLKIIKNSPQNDVLDTVPTFLSKNCVDILLPSVTKLVNLSLVLGFFPNNSRRRLLPPIKKASLPSDDLNNYCPVSGLCFMSKLVELVVVKHLMQHINSKNLDNPHRKCIKFFIPLKLLCCILKMRSISCCHVASLLYLSYLICQLPSIQLTIILF